MSYLTFKSIATDFLGFLKKPNDRQVEISTQEKIKLLLIFLLGELIFTFVIVFPLDYIIGQFIKIKPERIEYLQNTVYIIFFLFVILVPFIEEIIFRSYLRYHSVFKSIISRDQWCKGFPWLVYLSCIIFGLVHAGNYYNDSLTFYILSPLIVISQLSGAFIISFIRVRLNFYYGFLYHALWNFTAAILIPAVMILFSHPYIDKSADYTLTIEEKAFFKIGKTQTSSIDLRNNKVYKVESEQLYLQDILNMIYGKDQYYVDEVIVNMTFKSANGLSREEFKKVLEKEYEISSAHE